MAALLGEQILNVSTRDPATKTVPVSRNCGTVTL